MNVIRILNHLFFLDWQVQRAFPKGSLDAIAQAIHASEQTHGGEIRFVVEASLEGAPLWTGQTTRERAIDVFSQLRIWDTEGNNGVLIYLLREERVARREDASAMTGSIDKMANAIEKFGSIITELRITVAKGER